jgi:transcriptional regulator NrdR family protein
VEALMTGLVCPRCRVTEGALIKDSRPHVSGRARRYVCDCGDRFTTIEVVVSEKPRQLRGLQITDAGLTKAKLIARVSSLLERSL